ncbi:MAG: hypothetical protein SGPRY_011185, partial [Prymnesium sp.]
KTGSEVWQAYEVATISYGELCAVMKRAYSRFRGDKRILQESPPMKEYFRALKAT